MVIEKAFTIGNIPFLLDNAISFIHHDGNSKNTSQFLFDQNVKESGQKLSFELKTARLNCA